MLFLEKFLERLGNKKIIFVFIGIGFALFFNSLFNEFVIDDIEIIQNNKVVQSIGNLPRFFQGGAFARGSATTLYGQYYRPLMLSSFSLIYTFFKANVLFYHLFQVILFSINAYLVFLLLKRFLEPSLSFVLSLVFLVHPINMIAAVFVSSLGDPLFMFFGLLALLIFFSSKTLSGGRLFIIGSLLLFSILSKEAGILFFVLILFTSLFFKRSNFPKILSAEVISGGIYLYLRIFVAHLGLVDKNFTPIQKAGFLEKLITMPKILSYYLGNLVYPKNLAMFQHWTVKNISFTNFILPVLIITIFVIALVLIKKGIKNKKELKVYKYFLVWFLVGSILLLPFFPIDMTVSDRWFCFPFIGLLGMIGIFLQNTKLINHKPFVYIIFFIVILFSVRTFVRNFDWKNNFSLGKSDIKYADDSFEVQNLYGIELAKKGNLDEGELHLKKSVELLPYGGNLNNLATIYLAKGEVDLAIETFRTAASLGNYKAYENIASLLMINKDPELALKETKSFLEKFPSDPKLWQILSLIQLKMKNQKEAIQSAKTYSDLSKTPDSLKFYNLVKSGATYDQFIKK